MSYTLCAFKKCAFMSLDLMETVVNAKDVVVVVFGNCVCVEKRASPERTPSNETHTQR